MQKNIITNVEFIPRFQFSFLHPRYWGLWLTTGILVLLVYFPPRWRDPLLGNLGRLIGRLIKGPRRRAKINLIYCLPELDVKQREKLLDNMFATALQSTVLLAELAIRDPKHVQQRTVWFGEHYINQARAAGHNVIFMVPHGWSVDIPAMLLAARGFKMAAMFHHQKNPLSDWLWNTARRRFGGRMHARQDGIKPFINSVRNGYMGYYLPDQDHGAQHSEFVDFFSTYKATLPAIGRLKKVCRAEIIPLFPVYNARASQLEIYVQPAISGLTDVEPDKIARRMNEEVENLVRPNPEQYIWILKLLKTRRQGEIEPYQRDDL